MRYVYYLLFLQANFLFAQTKSIQFSEPLSVADPETVGISSPRLDRIDQMCQQAIDDGSLPGMVAMVARRGKIIYHKAFGSADADGRTLSKDDIFRIASQTKAITSTAVMMLWEQGLFQLDDPISKYIPDFKNPKVLTSFSYGDTTYTSRPADGEITIRHLLTHTSGLGYGVIDADERFRLLYGKAGVTDLFTTEPVTIAQSVKILASLPLHHDPGAEFTYSEGLDVLGYFVEVISGKPFDQFLKEHLFDPLGMSDTYFYLPTDKQDKLVSIQTKKNDQWVNYPVTFYDPDYPKTGAKTFFSGGAGLCSTAKDYATFLQMYLNHGELGGTRILSRTTIQSMMGNQIGDLWEGQGSYYGLAFGVIDGQGQAQGGRGSSGTFDWGGYFNTQYFADPQEQLIGILMKQTRNTPDDTGWRFRLLTGQAIDD